MAHEEETRKRILDAAFDRFSTTHYSRVSLTDIMNDVGISKGGLFHHFDSKYDLAMECLFHWAGENIGPEMDLEQMQGSDPREVLGGIIDMSVDLIVQERQFTLFVLGLYEEAIAQGKNLDLWTRFLESYIVVAEDCFRRMGCADPRSRALLFLSGLDGIGLYHAMIKSSEDTHYLEKIKKELYRTYLDGANLTWEG